METTISDKRRVKDETVGHAAKVSTSTLKPKTKASTPKAAKTKTKTKQTADDQAAIERAMASQGLQPEAPPAAPKRGRPKHLQSVPDPEPDPFEGLEPVESNLAWCGLCGGLLFQTPKGVACRTGHGLPPSVDWERAAKLLYDRGASCQEAAEAMEAEQADIGDFFDELDARTPTTAAEPAPGASDEETERGAVQSFRAGASYETVERFYGEALGAERLQQLFEQHGTKPEPEPEEEPAPAPEPEEVIEYEPISLDGAEAVAEYFEHKHLPPQVAMGGHGMAAQVAAMEADDARQLQPVFAVGDRVTPVENIVAKWKGEPDGPLYGFQPGDDLRVAIALPADDVYEVWQSGTTAEMGAYAEVSGAQIRHFTERRVLDAAAAAGWPAAEEPRTRRAPEPGNAPAKSWVELQLATAPLSAADYERLGRLWVGALIAGVDIQTYARREREVLAHVRSDILGRLDPGRGGE